MKWRELLMADLRLAVLKIVAEAPGYELGSGMLIAVLEQYGHHVSHDGLATQLAWLAEQGLITLSTAASVYIATLTASGLDVAMGRSLNPGVARPAPGE